MTLYPRRNYLLSALSRVTLCLLGLVWTNHLNASGATLTLDAKRLNGLSQSDNGEVSASRGNGEVKSFWGYFPTALAPGWYQVKGEYRTEDINPMGSFVLDVNGPGINGQRQTLSPSEQWMPFTLFFRIQEEGIPKIQISDIKEAGADSYIRLRSLNYESCALKEGENLLLNSDFELGQEGAVPVGWFWQYNGSLENYATKRPSDFRKGQQSLLMGGGEEDYNLSSNSVPLPTRGDYTFSIWAKSEEPGTILTLMLIGDLYKWHKQQAFRLSSEWQEFIIHKKCPEDSQNPFAYARLSLKKGGSAILDGAKLVWTDSSEEHAAIEYPAYFPVKGELNNMLWNSGFELGMNNWMYDFFGIKTFEGALVPGIQDDKGIDGSAAMLLSANNCLISGSVPIVVGETYTLSAYVKPRADNNNIKMMFLDPGWKNISKSFSNLPVNEWTRIHYTAKWEKPSLREKAYVRIDGNDVLIDNLQLERGVLTEYRPGDLQAGFVTGSKSYFFRDEEAPDYSLKLVSAVDEPEAVTIKVGITDAWGKTVDTITLNETIAPGANEFPLALPSIYLGVFDLKASVTDAQGKLLAQCPSRYAVLEPALRDDENPMGLFDIQIETLSLPPWLIEKNKPLWRALGAQSNRIFITQKSKETLDLDPEVVASAKERFEMQLNDGLDSLMLSLGRLPYALEDEFLASESLTDEQLAAYSTYIRNVVEAFQDQVLYYEILNEPNLWRYRSGPNKGYPTMPPAKCVQLLKTAYETIKSINPELQVVGVCLNSTDFNYLRGVLEAGGANYMDVFSFHPYRTSPDIPDVYDDLVIFRELLDSYGFTGPMVNTEQYFAANKYIMHGSDGESFKFYYVPGDEELDAAAKTIRTYIYHAALRVPYYAFSPQLTLFRYGGYDQEYLFYFFGAYNAATRFLVNAGEGEPLALGSTIRAFAFINAEGGPLVTLNTRDGANLAGTMTLAADVQCFDMMGNAFSQGGTEKTIPLGSTPVYLKFPEGTTLEGIAKKLMNADVLGLGAPFDIQASLSGENTITVTVTNRLNKVSAGHVELSGLPAIWNIQEPNQKFDDLNPGDSVHLSFSGSLDIQMMHPYSLSVLVSSDSDEFVKEDKTLLPLLSTYNKDIVADGALEDWENAQWLTVGEDQLTFFEPKPEYTGNDDLSAELAVAWCEDYLALAVKVTDSKFVEPESSASAWNADSIQIYFDQLNNAMDGDDFYDGDDVSYAISFVDGQSTAWLEKGSEGRYIGEANASTGDDRVVRVKVTRQGNQTIYEIVIPRECLPMVNFEEGQVIGFSMLVNDTDGDGRKALTLTPAGTQPHRRPYLFLDMCLIK